MLMSSCIVSICYLFLFVCKQKTAYEMPISDWSSDVCSSDLLIFDLAVITVGRRLELLRDDEQQAEAGGEGGHADADDPGPMIEKPRPGALGHIFRTGREGETLRAECPGKRAHADRQQRRQQEGSDRRYRRHQQEEIGRAHV